MEVLSRNNKLENNMKNFLKQNWTKIIIVLLASVLVGVVVVTFNNKNSTNPKEVKKSFRKNDVSRAIQITCTYPQVLQAKYLDGEVSHTIPEPETNPMIFTFSKLKDSEVGQLSYLDASLSITNVPIYKVIDNSEKIVYLDGAGENYLSTHTIYKESGVSIYTKTVSILGIPLGILSAGTCVGY